MSSYILYGAEISYFTGKARAYLRWRGLDFEERAADADFYRQICVPRIGYPMIPLLLTPEDTAIQDTTLIMQHFEQGESGSAVFSAVGEVQGLVAALIELYSDDWLLLPAMHYRWEYDADETMLEFGMNLLPDGSREEQAAFGEKRAGQFRGAVPFLGVHEHNKHLVERSYKELLADLDTHFRAHAYLLGNRPCTGDFALAGALYAHLYRDATAGALMRREALAVARYVERMMHPSGAPLDKVLPDDQIPETLIPVLQRMMREQMPVLAGTARALAVWRSENPGQEIPRAIGFQSFELYGVAADRAIMPYATWLHGRARDAYLALSEDATPRGNDLLAACKGALFQETVIDTPLLYRDYKLHWQ